MNTESDSEDHFFHPRRLRDLKRKITDQLKKLADPSQSRRRTEPKLMVSPSLVMNAAALPFALGLGFTGSVPFFSSLLKVITSTKKHKRSLLKLQTNKTYQLICISK